MRDPDLGDHLYYMSTGAWDRYLEECITAIDDCLSLQDASGAEREQWQMQRVAIMKIGAGEAITKQDCELLGWEWRVP